MKKFLVVSNFACVFFNFLFFLGVHICGGRPSLEGSRLPSSHNTSIIKQSYRLAINRYDDDQSCGCINSITFS